MNRAETGQGNLLGEQWSSRNYAGSVHRPAPLGAELHLVHVFSQLPISTLEYGLMPTMVDVGYVQEFRPYTYKEEVV
jgi:hypothetical protein